MPEPFLASVDTAHIRLFVSVDALMFFPVLVKCEFLVAVSTLKPLSLGVGEVVSS